MFFFSSDPESYEAHPEAGEKKWISGAFQEIPQPQSQGGIARPRQPVRIDRPCIPRFLTPSTE